LLQHSWKQQQQFCDRLFPDTIFPLVKVYNPLLGQGLEHILGYLQSWSCLQRPRKINRVCNQVRHPNLTPTEYIIAVMADKNKSLLLVYTNISAAEGTKVSSQWSRLNFVIFISMVEIKFGQLLLAAAEERTRLAGYVLFKYLCPHAGMVLHEKKSENHWVITKHHCAP